MKILEYVNACEKTYELFRIPHGNEAVALLREILVLKRLVLILDTAYSPMKRDSR